MNQALSIYHAFDMKYEEIILILQQLKNDGYTHIQLSPSQKSRTTIPNSAPRNTNPAIWWMRYQPIEFTIGNYYGTREQLILLTTEAHKIGLKVISDVCLNFMAEIVSNKEWIDAEKNNRKDLLEEYYKRLDTAYPPFTGSDFKPRTKYNEHTKRYDRI